MVSKGRKFRRNSIVISLLQLVSCGDGFDHSGNNNHRIVKDEEPKDCKCEGSGLSMMSRNEMDKNRMRQGKWTIYGHMKPDLGYPENNVIEEGRYVDDAKQGKWIEYNKNGTIHSFTVFSCDTLHGDTKEFDYEKGLIITSNYFKGEIRDAETTLFSTDHTHN